MAELRAVASAPHLNALWQAGLRQSAVGSKACPSCLQPMRLLQEGTITLDGCLSCQFLWFDAGEMHALPEIPPEELAAIQRVQERAADMELRSAEQLHSLESHPLLDWIQLIWSK
jgi:Zn-finger nucleic acid-binding protein